MAFRDQPWEIAIADIACFFRYRNISHWKSMIYRMFCDMSHRNEESVIAHGWFRLRKRGGVYQGLNDQDQSEGKVQSFSLCCRLFHVIFGPVRRQRGPWPRDRNKVVHWVKNVTFSHRCCRNRDRRGVIIGLRWAINVLSPHNFPSSWPKLKNLDTSPSKPHTRGIEGSFYSNGSIQSPSS